MLSGTKGTIKLINPFLTSIVLFKFIPLIPFFSYKTVENNCCIVCRLKLSPIPKKKMLGNRLCAKNLTKLNNSYISYFCAQCNVCFEIPPAGALFRVFHSKRLTVLRANITIKITNSIHFTIFVSIHIQQSHESHKPTMKNNIAV